jgi:hypothetical protein
VTVSSWSRRLNILVSECIYSTQHAKVSYGPVRSYLVDPASGHMLVSKIKPCMS